MTSFSTKEITLITTSTLVLIGSILAIIILELLKKKESLKTMTDSSTQTTSRSKIRSVAEARRAKLLAKKQQYESSIEDNIDEMTDSSYCQNSANIVPSIIKHATISKNEQEEEKTQLIHA